MFHVVVNDMVMGFRFAFGLVDNFVYLQSFVIESYYYMTLSSVLFVVFFSFRVYGSKRSG